MVQQSNSGSLWAEALITSLVRRGVSTFFVAPGSRSTPLVLAAARQPRARTVVHFDERGAAFAAVGYARGARRPAAVITTSGTAVANLLPAVVEASEDAVPLILLTADRPKEMRGTGANQTIDQVGIFGTYVRLFSDVEPPDGSHEPDADALIDRAISAAVGADAGPVHLNCMFRKPLQRNYDAVATRQAFLTSDQAAGTDSGVESEDKHHVSALPEQPIQPGQSLPPIQPVPPAFAAARTARVVVVAGRMDAREQAEEVVALARSINCPLLADIGSQVPRGAGWPVVSAPDVILGSPAISDTATEMVFHVGGRIVSQRLRTWLESAAPRAYLHVAFNDRPFKLSNLAIERMRGPLSGIAAGIRVRCDEDWRARWRLASDIAHTQCAIDPEGEVLTERMIARDVWHLIPPDWGLLVGNSMPVRDFDSFAWGADGPSFVVTNRGASGIDGLVATAVGAGLGAGVPMVAVVGDQSLLHDLNSLALVARSQYPVLLLVVNNGGGGIFSILPIAAHEDVFASHFAAEHDWTFERAAGQFGLPYVHVDASADFKSALRRAIRFGTSCVVEVETNRGSNQRDRIAFGKAVARSLSGPA